MSCRQCQAEVIGSADARVWYRRIGNKAVVRFFCSSACKAAWVDAGALRVIKALAAFEAELN